MEDVALLPVLEVNCEINRILVNEQLRKSIFSDFAKNEDEISDWLVWCRKNCRVKVTDYEVPAGILPSHLSGVLHDVKVETRGTDDAVYNSDPEIRDKVARGNTVLTLHNAATQTHTVDMVTFALRKFTGGMGDEDEDQPEDNYVWQRYFLKPMEEVKSIVITEKQNGEAAHFSARFIDGTFYFIGGSKNVHMIFRGKDDINKYKDSRFQVAKNICESILDHLETLASHVRRLLLSFLHWSKMTVIMEILQPSYQHVVDLSYLTRPCLKMLCFTSPYTTKQNSMSLTTLPPHVALELGIYFGLSCTQYEVIGVDEFEHKMTTIRQGSGYEGSVLYFLDAELNVVGLLKKKTIWYIVLRAIREKVANAMTDYRKNPGGFNLESKNTHVKKMNKRLDEIQKWLGMSDAEVLQWRKLGIAFLTWMLEQMVRTKNPELTDRGKFPPNWNRFLLETGAKEPLEGFVPSPAQDIKAENSGEPADKPLEPAVRLLEPSALSPTISVSSGPSVPCILPCIFRNLDLMGKNLKKLEGILTKTHQKACKEKAEAFISVHNLDKLSKNLKVELEPLDNLYINTQDLDNVSGRDLLEKERRKSNTAFKNYLDSLTHFQVLRDESKILTIVPLCSCCSTSLDENTSDILVIVHCTSRDKGLKVLDGLQKNVFHACLGSSLEHRKTLVVEKVALKSGDGSLSTFPDQLDVM